LQQATTSMPAAKPGTRAPGCVKLRQRPRRKKKSQATRPLDKTVKGGSPSKGGSPFTKKPVFQSTNIQSIPMNIQHNKILLRRHPRRQRRWRHCHHNTPLKKASGRSGKFSSVASRGSITNTWAACRPRMHKWRLKMPATCIPAGQRV
jgi:hypothetical protein